MWLGLSGHIMCRKCPLGSSRHILSLDFLSDPLVLTVPQWDVSCASSLAAVTSRVSYRKPCSSLSSEIHPGLVLQPAGMLTFPSVSNLLLLSIVGLLMNGRRLIPESAGVSPSLDVSLLCFMALPPFSLQVPVPSMCPHGPRHR